MTRSSWTPVVLVWLVLSAIVLGVAAPPAGEPGLYYDEAFLAQQARDFLEPERPTRHPPGTTSVQLAGRRFPLRNAAYLGSLKSQLLIPALAVAGPDVATLRTATLATALLGLLFFMLWAGRVFGPVPAAVGGALTAFDPSFVFFGACEWGPFTTLLLCRGFGLYALTRGWQTERPILVVLGALAMGLGVYARADFVIIGVAAAVGLLAVHGGPFLREVRARPGTVVAALCAVVVGSLPMLLGVLDLLATQQGISDRGDLAYRAQVLWSSLDGSHFYRVIESGGLFERIFDGSAPASVFGWALVVAVAAGIATSFARERRDAGTVFLVVTVVFLAGAMCALPGAVRAHHMLNLLPFGHLLMAVLLVRFATSRRGKILAACALVLVVASEVRVTALTRDLISETGGRGRWSNALDAFAADLDADPDAVAISLDWGFHEPLLYLTRKQQLIEPIWNIPRLLGSGRAWAHAGDANHVYLVHDAPYDLFGFGAGLLETAGRTDRAEVLAHTDRRGDVAFYSVRFLAPHDLVYSGRFEVRFRQDGRPRPRGDAP